MFKKTLFLLITLSLFTISMSSGASVPERHEKSLLPQPKFEGWYMRLTDSERQRSFAVIVGSFMKTRTNRLPQKAMRGYLAVLMHDNRSGVTKSFEAFPQDTHYTTNGVATFGTHQLFKGSTFFWESKKYGHVSQDQINITIPGVIEVNTDIGVRLPWDNPNDRLGPEGMILGLPMVPLHWFVHSLGSNSTYNITLFDRQNDTEEWSGVGHLHQEKNWGKSFPGAWIWSEGISKNNTSQYALAGGEVRVAPLKFTSWLVGIRGKKVKWDFRHSRLGTKFTTVIDACKGKFELMANDSRHQIKLKAQAAINSFASVSIPTKKGFKKNGGIESFGASVEIKAYLKKGAKKVLQEVLFFKNAALEFGANYMCPTR